MLWKLWECVNQLAEAAVTSDFDRIPCCSHSSLLFFFLFCSISALKSAANMPFVDLHSRQCPPSVALGKRSAREEKQLWLAVQFRQQTAKHNESRQYFSNDHEATKAWRTKPHVYVKEWTCNMDCLFSKACLIVVDNIFKRRCVTSRSPGKLTLFSSPILRWCHPYLQPSRHAAFKAAFAYDISKATVNIYMTIWPQ